MFEYYRKILKIICNEKWNVDENRRDMNNFLNYSMERIFVNEPKLSIFLNLLSKLLQRAFNEEDKELLYIIINAIINFDEAVEKEAKDEKTKEAPATDKIKIEKKQPEITKIQDTILKNEVLSRSYGPVIKKNAIQWILSKIKKDFSLDDLKEIVMDYYSDILKKEKLDDKSMQTYSNSYIRFLVDFKLCRKDDMPKNSRPKRKDIIYHLTGKNVGNLEKTERIGKLKEKISRSSLSNVAQYIILWTEKNATDIVDIDAIYQHKLHPIGENYQIKDIYAGLDELAERSVATKFSEKRYVIKRSILKKD